MTTSEKAILGGYKPEMDMAFGAKKAQVSAYDTLTVTIDHLDGAGKVHRQDDHRAGLAVRPVHRRDRHRDHRPAAQHGVR